ncbi:helix-turn-helix transcriptional regulator [Coleofasciculus sp. FACHB-T130]|uniref:helix-turn-helix domain-containing protein n=1 Tax=Cyanophyceae TaxID=3028117 RepID=UPI001686DB5E|nr:helix-turn-helix transcriptional regulator [Coleofasciculus sp. FACHB-T130]MBD1882142.1 helix-turn-helix transcriptional regulator [Coleofasciculus sp. FACHB-T130]
MAMINTLEDFLKGRGVETPYQFWKDTGLAQATAYRLFRKRAAYPSKEAQDAICRTYAAQPGDFLRYVPDEESDRP